jgi:hypothetical protein
MSAEQNKSGTVRNLRSFLAAYFNSESGKQALKRQPRFYRDKQGRGNMDFANSAMATAFKQALEK